MTSETAIFISQDQRPERISVSFVILGFPQKIINVIFYLDLTFRKGYRYNDVSKKGFMTAKVL